MASTIPVTHLHWSGAQGTAPWHGTSQRSPWQLSLLQRGCQFAFSGNRTWDGSFLTWAPCEPYHWPTIFKMGEPVYYISRLGKTQVFRDSFKGFVVVLHSECSSFLLLLQPNRPWQLSHWDYYWVVPSQPVHLGNMLLALTSEWDA